MLQIAQETSLFKRCSIDRKKKYITLWRSSNKYDGVLILRRDLVVVIRGKNRRTGSRVFECIDLMDPHSLQNINNTLFSLVDINESNNSRQQMDLV